MVPTSIADRLDSLAKVSDSLIAYKLGERDGRGVDRHVRSPRPPNEDLRRGLVERTGLSEAADGSVSAFSTSLGAVLEPVRDAVNGYVVTPRRDVFRSTATQFDRLVGVRQRIPRQSP